MTQYRVHLYREMKLEYLIEAIDPYVAAEAARYLPTEEALSVKDCDGATIAALVDSPDDPDYLVSRAVDWMKIVDPEYFMSGVLERLVKPLLTLKRVYKLDSPSARGQMILHDLIRNAEAFEAQSAPVELPECYDSKPGAQAQAENGCEDCESQNDCLK